MRFSCLAHSGFGDRLLSEVKKLAPKDVKIRVGAWWGLALGLRGTGAPLQGYTVPRFHIDLEVCQREEPIFPLLPHKRGQF